MEKLISGVQDKHFILSSPRQRVVRYINTSADDLTNNFGMILPNSRD